MVSFFQSNVAVISAALLASMATSSEAAYGNLFVHSRPSRALGYRMPPALRSRSLFSRDFDAMFDSMLSDMNEMFYEPFPLQRMSRPRYLLQGSPMLNELVQARPQEVAKNAFGITQDDKQLQIAVDVPGAKAGDVNLQLEGNVLTISGETKRENEGISVHSRFKRSFTLTQDVNVDEISARMDGGVLTITAPKHVAVEETVRRIDIVEDEKAETGETVDTEAKTDVTLPQEKENPEKPGVVDESVIDLDAKKE